MAINWDNLFSWGRSAGLGVAGAAAAVTQLPAAGVAVDPKVLAAATAITGFAAGVAGISHVAKEIINPATFPQTPISKP